MKAIKSDIIITSLRALTDGSLSLTIHTPELKSLEKVELMNLQNVVCEALIAPKEGLITETVQVDSDIEQKSQSERIRAVLYLLYLQDGSVGEFRDYYKVKTEKYIEFLKSKLDESY